MTYTINSFEERGVAIPFTGATLAHARLRTEMAGEGLRREFLLPNFVDGGSATFVVDFKHLPSIVELNLEDQALYDLLSDVREITPVAIYKVITEMQAKGFAGAGKARSAKREIKAAKDAVMYNQYQLVIAALRKISPGVENFEIVHLMAPEGQARAKEGFRHFADAQGTTGNGIMEKLNKWAEIVSPVGLQNGDMPGYLTAKLKQLQRLSADLKVYLNKQPPEVQMVGRTIIETAQQASSIVLNEIATIYRCEEKIENVLSKSDHAFEQLQKRINTIAWMLDGWGQLIEAWNNSDEHLKADRRAVVEMIGNNLPIIPRAMTVSSRLHVHSSRLSPGGTVRANIDWRTLAPDTEMLQRLATSVQHRVMQHRGYQPVAA